MLHIKVKHGQIKTYRWSSGALPTAISRRSSWSLYTIIISYFSKFLLPDQVNRVLPTARTVASMESLRSCLGSRLFKLLLHAFQASAKAKLDTAQNTKNIYTLCGLRLNIKYQRFATNQCFPTQFINR